MSFSDRPEGPDIGQDRAVIAAGMREMPESSAWLESAREVDSVTASAFEPPARRPSSAHLHCAGVWEVPALLD